MSEDTQEPVVETRIDEHAVSILAGLGYPAPLSDNMVTVYKAFKRHHDVQQPTRLSPDGFAAVAVISDMVDGNINFVEQGQLAEE